MFRALTCPSSGGKIVFSQYLVSSLSVNGCTVHSTQYIQVSLKSDKKQGYFTLRPIYIFDHISLSSSCRLWDNVEKRNVVEPDRPQIYNKIRRMRIACWITKSRIHTEYAIIITFTLHHWLRERPSILRLDVHCLSCMCCPPIFVSSFHYLI